MGAEVPAPGQDPGHPGWALLIDALLAEHGSLAAVAEILAAERGHREDLGSVERGLRRLRQRGSLDGGVWGRRVLARFGLPAPIGARLRWMGLYHSRFTDLPLSLGLELLRPWDQPLTRGSPARAWLDLAWAGLALRARDADAAARRLREAGRAASGGAVVEHRLASAFSASREHPEAIPPLLDEAEAALRGLPPDADAACWWARLVDQRGWLLNRSGESEAAEALYRALPEAGVPPFARCRRANGLAWCAFKRGDRDAAIALARESAEAAGDAGSLRMRAMALQALGRFLGEAGGEVRRRAAEIAAQLEDAELLGRFSGAG